MNPDWTAQPPSRMPLQAANGAVATGHPLATSAALEILQAGGNAVDAALAASATLCVVMPHMTGLGGDGFVQVVEPDGRVTAYNSGGTAGSGAHPDRYPQGVPRNGLHAACIPGLPDCWALLHADHATLPLDRLLARALASARDGFPVSHNLAGALQQEQERLAPFPASARIFLPHGAPPSAGDLLLQTDLARTLETVAQGGRAAFYEGPIAQALADAFTRDADALITADDLQRHRADAGDPLCVPYRDCLITEQPPVSQGHLLLQELLILDHLDLRALPHLSAEAVHTMVEAKKLAFADRTHAAADPRFVNVDWDWLLSPQRAAERLGEIDPHHASAPAGAGSVPTDTTQFVVGDRDGRAVTFIQSLYHPFGCAAVADGTGFLLNNRLLGFGTDPTLPNVMAPGKRTLHTLNTYTASRNGALFLVGGTPGADFQVQTNLQILTAIIDYGLPLTAAVDAPRWGHLTGRTLLLESRIPANTQSGLQSRGHDLVLAPPWAPELGCAMLLGRGPHGWLAVADQRREHALAGY